MKAAIFCCVVGFPPIAAADGYGFMTPSGNIYCNGEVQASTIHCVIVERSGTPPVRQPAACSGIWGHHFTLRANGVAEMSCGKRPQRVNYGDIAEYGVSASFGDITCASDQSGLSCKNRTGNGFFLSRQTQRLF